MRLTSADCRIAIECGCNRSLDFESDKIHLFNSISAHALSDCIAVIIQGITIEVTAMAVLAILWAHLDHYIDEEAFLLVSPLVDLNESAVVKAEVKHFEILTKLAVRLKDLTSIVVSDIKLISLESTRELGKNRRSVVKDRGGRNPENVIVHTATTDGDLLCYRQASCNMRWLVSALHLQLVTLDDPELTSCVEIVVVAIETFTVRIAIYDA